MSYSTILIHHQGPLLSLKPNVVELNYRKLQTRKVVVCCCPWSEKKNKLVPQNKPNIIPTPLENIKISKATVPAELHDSTISENSGNSKHYFPFNFISYLLSLGPLSMILDRSGKRQKLPPTPSLQQLLSLSHYLVRPRPHHHPLADLADKCGPLVYLEMGERSAAIISSAKIAKEVLSTNDLAFAERPKIVGSQILMYNNADVFFHKYDGYWKQMRKLMISEFLNSKKVGSLEHIRAEESAAVMESIRSNCGSGGVPFNLTHELYMYTFTVACRSVFGKMAVDKGEAVMSIKKAVELVGRLSVIDMFPSIKALNCMSRHKKKLQKSWRQLDTMLEGLIDFENRDDGDEHFVDVLRRLKESGELEYPLTDDAIKSLALDMVVGGADSSPLADWAMVELMKNPGVMAKAQDEIRKTFEGSKTIQECEIGRLKYLKLVIMETLRLHPNSPLILRSCREEAEIDGCHIPLNSVVIINAWAIGRDPTYWKNPESFEPERFEANPVNFSGAHFEFLPFGSGRRVCPGKTFALAEIELILAQLLYHFDWELPPSISPDDLDMTDVGGISVSRKAPLYLIAKPYC